VLARAPQFVEHLLLADVQVGPVFRKRLLDPRGRPMAPTLPTVVVSQRSRSSSQVKTPTADSAEGAEANADNPPGAPGAPGAPAAPVAVRLAAEEETYRALVLGTRDYVRKNGFSDVVIGLSGGIDSTLVAVIAADALGPERVHGVSMPSRFSSDGSRNDARALAERLGIDFQSIPIEAIHAQYLATLDPVFAGREADLTEENLQARIRGALLMALSNKFGWMVLTTGNKSEAAVGYMTLYGDMCGGYAVLMDVLKTDVYDLCRWRNASAGAEVISEAVLTKPPSAELRPDQRDDQSLPPYEVLDPILRGYVERDLTIDDLVDSGFARDLVERIARLVDRAEYKRRQAPPGIRVTPKAFGRDRRLPITNRFPG
jgi:NAD+ synthase (glutamine-hydrolysing)